MPPAPLTPTGQAVWQAKEALKLTKPQADFMSCLLGAVLASLPTFLAAFMDCLGGGGSPGTGEYNPGERTRCQQ